jgi:hypothetical protein
MLIYKVKCCCVDCLLEQNTSADSTDLQDASNPLAMLAAQCNRLAQRSPPPLSNPLAMAASFTSV